MAKTIKPEARESQGGPGDRVAHAAQSDRYLQRLRNTVVRGGYSHWPVFLEVAGRYVESRRLDLVNAAEFQGTGNRARG
jgi:hypothetical protein